MADPRAVWAGLPLLDRLTDEDPDKSSDGPVSQAYRVDQLRDSIRYDLEALLNSRRRFLPWSGNFPEVEQSLLTYGVDDFASDDFSNREFRQVLRREIEKTIRKFEPRLPAVSVIFLDNDDPLDRSLRFRIDAVLRLGRDSEEVIFDSVMEPVKRSVTIEEG